VETGNTRDVVSHDPIRAVYGVDLVENARIGFEMASTVEED
jgi:hypothetical protein